MNKQAIIIAISIFILIIIGMFVFAYLRGEESEVTNPPVVEDGQPADETPDPYAYIERIDAKHFYQDGVHTLAGEVNLPTPCDLLETKASVMESAPEQVRIDFTVINNAEACAQVITAQRFKVAVEASPEATFGAYFNHRPVTLNLIEALPGETPEEFEIFIKG